MINSKQKQNTSQKHIGKQTNDNDMHIFITTHADNS